MNRPYSVIELKDLERELHSKHRLSDVFVQHMPCMHKYRVKKGGRKEQHATDITPILDDLTCSVCFKLRTSSECIPDETINEICSNDGKDDADGINLSKQYLSSKDFFYKWLYRHEYA